MILRGLAIDNGGSEVRTLSLDGKLTTLTNDFVRIKREDFRYKDTENPLELCDVVEAPKEEYVGIIARGMTGKMYDSKMLNITSQSAKTESIAYYNQFIYAIARDAMEEKLRRTEAKENMKLKVIVPEFLKDTTDMFEYIICTCIPIKEHSGKNDCATKLKAKLAGDYTVEFPLLPNHDSVRFRLTATNIGVVPEGGVAMTALRNEINPEDISIVIDIGHITMDMALFKGKTIYGNKVISAQRAGSTLISLARSSLEDAGYFVNNEQAGKAIETGIVKRGAINEDISNLILEEKKAFVKNYIYPKIVDLLNMNSINASQVQNIIPIGAAMNDKSFIEEIINICGFRDAMVKKLSDDLRHVNVQQAVVFVKVMYNAKMQSIQKTVS